MTKLEKAFFVVVVLFAAYHLGRWHQYHLEGNQTLINNYNSGYRAGMLYAYDNVTLCKANAEQEGTQLARTMALLGELEAFESADFCTN